MKNEVYGTISFDVSMETKSESEKLALLEANYNVNSDRIMEEELFLTNVNGNVIGKLKVHNVEVNWERFFSENE